jgi:hypothetical protein
MGTEVKRMWDGSAKELERGGKRESKKKAGEKKKTKAHISH